MASDVLFSRDASVPTALVCVCVCVVGMYLSVCVCCGDVCECVGGVCGIYRGGGGCVGEGVLTSHQRHTPESD